MGNTIVEMGPMKKDVVSVFLSQFLLFYFKFIQENKLASTFDVNNLFGLF